MHLFFRDRMKGIAMVLVGASLWGISGTVAQALFHREGIHADWLVTVRLLCSGLVLLIWASLNKQKIWAVWRSLRDAGQILCFGLIGLLGVQYTYFISIEAGNATTATLLQYLGPAFITLYVALRLKRWPQRKDVAALALALLGTFLLVTNGSLKGLTVPVPAVVWGLLSALTAAFYTVYPSEMIRRWGSMTTIGWGMLIGGLGMGLFSPPWTIRDAHLSVHSLLLVAFVVLFGTLISFYLYIDSLRYLSPAEVGVLGSAEPLSAAVMSVIWLHHVPGLFEMIGGISIMATVAILSSKKNERKVITVTQKGI
ncbi:transporter [Collibacillus ludicampi]|uniref:Transporter n=1 Tax=Collibacillus ludicampi TaxID=2771369 RepID=A0AAV4L9X1_9BACL|nr:DMT family transporter [Collibacillus ludicampi]GIM44488.1 transporter [Collibacillus ludicampi]